MSSSRIRTRPRRRRTAATLGLIGCAVSSVAIRAKASTAADWLTPADGNWTEPSNWSSSPNYPRNGAPSASDTYQATIGATGSSYTVTLDASGVPGGSITVDQLRVESAG